MPALRYRHLSGMIWIPSLHMSDDTPSSGEVIISRPGVSDGEILQRR